MGLEIFRIKGETQLFKLNLGIKKDKNWYCLQRQTLLLPLTYIVIQCLNGSKGRSVKPVQINKYLKFCVENCSEPLDTKVGTNFLCLGWGTQIFSKF